MPIVLFQVVVAEVSNDRKSDEQLDSQLQWQLNLLTHIESVQSEVTSRMDLIEKEVDGMFLVIELNLESRDFGLFRHSDTKMYTKKIYLLMRHKKITIS